MDLIGKHINKQRKDWYIAQGKNIEAEHLARAQQNEEQNE